MSPRRQTTWDDTAGTAETRRRLGLVLAGAIIFAADFAGALHWRAIVAWMGL